jgi:hypothetical protein
VNELRVILEREVDDPAWLTDALAAVAVTPAALPGLFAAAGRRCGRGPARGLPGWDLDEAARVLLLSAVGLSGTALMSELRALYRYGDTAEKLAILRALPGLDVGTDGDDLLRDAIRSNDPRLVAAALGPCASRLDDPTWRQAVIKCVFMEIPLTSVTGLAERADAELARMLAGLADERRSAGRRMPADADALLARLTGTKLSGTELSEEERKYADI